MLDDFRRGGWGMLPIVIMGLLFVIAAFLFGRRPEKRRVPLLLCLSFMTLLAGALGSLTGIASTMAAAASGKLEGPLGVVLLEGTAESLQPLRFSLILIALGTMLTADGALKIWRGR